jgi:hypothetical protein
MSYPTNLGLLDQARKQTEKTIDTLYNSLEVKNINKPRTYRNMARKIIEQWPKKKNNL